MKKLLILSVFLFAIFTLTAQTSQKIELTDLLKIKIVSQPQFSPDGKKYIYLVKSILDDPEKKGGIFLSNTSVSWGYANERN